MDEKPSLLQRAHAAIVYLGAFLLLIESWRTVFSWLRTRQRSFGQGNGAERFANPHSVALLVDGENLALTRVEHIVEHALHEAKKLGKVNVKRVYGNCYLFNNNNNKWNDTCLRLDLEQIHLTRPTATKNTADIALAVDAIELAVEGSCNSFCIVTSDSDFTPLVRRLRKLKCQVVGIGEKKTPKALTKACNRFVFTDELADDPVPTPSPASPHPQFFHSQPAVNPPAGQMNRNPPAQPSAPLLSDITPASRHEGEIAEKAISVLTDAYLDAAHGIVGEWVLLSKLGLSLSQRHPEFRATEYAEDLSSLIRRYPTKFEFSKRANGHPQMRLKPEII